MCTLIVMRRTGCQALFDRYALFERTETLFLRRDFLELDIIAQIALFLLSGLGLCPVGLLGLHLVVHPLLHLAEALFDLPGGAVDGNDEFEYQLVQDIC